MLFSYAILGVCGLFGCFLAWQFGLAGVFNTLRILPTEKSVLSLKKRLLITLFHVLGAVLLGAGVGETLAGKLIAPSLLQHIPSAAAIVLSTLIVTLSGVSLTAWKRLPVSITVLLTGSLAGACLGIGGLEGLNWRVAGTVALAWAACPIFSFMLAGWGFRRIVRHVLARPDADAAATAWSPVFIGTPVLLMILALLILHFKVNASRLVWSGAGCLLLLSAMCIGIWGKRYFPQSKTTVQDAEGIFDQYRIVGLLLWALTQGANDAGKAMAPAAILYALCVKSPTAPLMTLPLLTIAAAGLAAGSLMGWRRASLIKMPTLTMINSSRGLVLDLSATLPVFAASLLGLPVSTSHAFLGGILGLARVGGMEAVNRWPAFNTARHTLLALGAAAAAGLTISYFIVFIR